MPESQKRILHILFVIFGICDLKIMLKIFMSYFFKPNFLKYRLRKSNKLKIVNLGQANTHTHTPTNEEEVEENQIHRHNAKRDYEEEMRLLCFLFASREIGLNIFRRKWKRLADARKPKMTSCSDCNFEYVCVSMCNIEAEWKSFIHTKHIFFTLNYEVSLCLLLLFSLLLFILVLLFGWIVSLLLLRNFCSFQDFAIVTRLQCKRAMFSWTVWMQKFFVRLLAQSEDKIEFFPPNDI